MTAGKSPKLRVCAAISGRATVLKALLQASACDLIPLEFSGFVSDRPCDGLEVARGFEVPNECIDYRAFPSREAFDIVFESAVLAFEPDLVLLHYNRLISPKLLAALPGRVINTHYSLLPAFTGFRAIPRALGAGLCFTGVTIHVVTERIDDGPILAQAVCPVRSDDTESSLGFRLFAACVPLTLGLLVSAPRFDRTAGDQFSLPDGTRTMLSVGLSEQLKTFANQFVIAEASKGTAKS